MSSLAESTVLYTAVVAVICLVLTLTGRERPVAVDLALVVCGLAAVGVAVLGVVSLVRGHRPDDLATHVGYLVTVPLVLPATAGSAGRDRGRWSSAAYVAGSLVLVVVLIRLVATAHG